MVTTLLTQYIKALDGQDFLLVLLSIVIGLGLGILFEKTILKLLKKILNLIPKDIGNSFVDSFKNVIIFWGGVIGLYLALKHIGMGPRMTLIVRESIIVLSVMSSGLIVSRFLVYRVKYTSGQSNHGLAATSIFSNIIKILIFITSLLIALRILNVPVGPAWTALGVGGIAIALALKDTLENFFGGLQLIFSKQVKIGDYVILSNDEEGYVRDITWRNTSIETPEGSTLIIPNSKLSTASVTNCSVPDNAVISKIKFLVSAYSDVKIIEDIAINVSDNIQKNSVFRSKKEFKPIVRLKELNNFGQEWEVLVLCKKAEYSRMIKHEVLLKIITDLQSKNIPLLPVAEDRIFAARNDNNVNMGGIQQSVL
jgi:small-conductance mechanosensitive channel